MASSTKTFLLSKCHIHGFTLPHVKAISLTPVRQVLQPPCRITQTSHCSTASCAGVLYHGYLTRGRPGCVMRPALVFVTYMYRHAVCLTHSLFQRVHHKVRSSASSCDLQYLLVSWTSSTSLIKSSLADSRIKSWKFSNVSGTDSVPIFSVLLTRSSVAP